MTRHTGKHAQWPQGPADLPDRAPPSQRRRYWERITKACVQCGALFRVDKPSAPYVVTCSTQCSRMRKSTARAGVPWSAARRARQAARTAGNEHAHEQAGQRRRQG